MEFLPDCLQSHFWSSVFDGLTLGSIYATIALGYTMVYGVLHLINFAHSEVFMVGTFAGVWALRAVGVDEPQTGLMLPAMIALAILPAMALSGFTAVAIERIAYRPLRKRGAPRLAFLITAIGMSIFVSNLFFVKIPVLGWTLGGAAPLTYPDVIRPATVFTLFGYEFTNKQMLVVVTTALMFIFLDRFVRLTRTGKSIRAVAEEPEAASLMGIPINRIIVITFLIGGILAGVAGALYGIFYERAQFNIGFIPGIKAFIAAVLGGIGNIRGALLGGLLLGLFENLGVACTQSSWQDVIAFSILVIVLMFRPTGIVGERVRA